MRLMRIVIAACCLPWGGVGHAVPLFSNRQQAFTAFAKLGPAWSDNYQREINLGPSGMNSERHTFRHGNFINVTFDGEGAVHSVILWSYGQPNPQSGDALKCKQLPNMANTTNLLLGAVRPSYSEKESRFIEGLARIGWRSGGFIGGHVETIGFSFLGVKECRVIISSD